MRDYAEHAHHSEARLRLPATVRSRVAGLDSVKIAVVPWTQWREIEPEWQRLWEATSFKSTFMSTEWVSTWLDVFGEALSPEFVLVLGVGGVIGCCAVVRKREYPAGLPTD